MEQLFGIARTRVTPPPSSVKNLRALETGGKRFIEVVAGAGFGKSTHLAELVKRADKSAYLLLTPFETDQYQMVCLVAAALSRTIELPDSLPKEKTWRGLADALINSLEDQELTLFIDDIHHLDNKPGVEAIDYLLSFLPRSFRYVLVGRSSPSLKAVKQAKLRGQSQLISAEDLRLTSAEILALCDGEQELANKLEALTQGWPMACAYLADRDAESWQEGCDDLEELILEDLWDKLTPELQEFLSLCSVLDFLTPESCNELTGRKDAKKWLRELSQEGVFVTPHGDGLRIHPLVSTYLRSQLEGKKELRELAYRRRVDQLLAQERAVEAIGLLTELQEFAEATNVLETRGENWLKMRRHGLVLESLEFFSEPLSTKLQWLQAQALREAHDFPAAKRIFRQLVTQASEQRNGLLESKALRGLAEILIDTVSPKEATRALRRAYRVLPSEQAQEKALTLRLIVENCVNQGRTGAALRYERLAGKWSDNPNVNPVEGRLLLRMGKLHEAWEVTSRALASESEKTGSGHRDGHLLLSYLASLQGQQTLAEEHARKGLEQAREADSRLTEAVGLIRLAHALSLKDEPDFEAVMESYGKARVIARELGVARLEAELLMGEALVFSARGRTADSYRAATMAGELTEQAGDHWLSAWIRLVLGISAHSGSHPEAENLLILARQEMVRCKDQFGHRIVSLWLALRGQQDLEAWTQRATERGYDDLLNRPTLFGPRTPLKPEKPSGLRVMALGPMRVFLGDRELKPKDFKRKKARELLALFLSRVETSIPRDLLMETLWPEATQKAALRDVRVALHALSDALEPERAKNTTAAPIHRTDEVYTFRLDTLTYDVSEFESLYSESQNSDTPWLQWEKAVALSQGDFLDDFPYLEWTQATRERLRQLYLEMAGLLAQRFIDLEQLERASELAHAMLERDKCWEVAYQILMRTHLAADRKFLVARVYDQCAEALQSELGVEPSDETEELLAKAT